MRHPDEDGLVRRAQAGDHAAYVTLIDCHGKGIYRLLLGLQKTPTRPRISFRKFFSRRGAFEVLPPGDMFSGLARAHRAGMPFSTAGAAAA